MVGAVQRPSNLVWYYTLVGYVVVAIYLTREILYVVHDRVGYYMVIGQVCCYNIAL